MQSCTPFTNQNISVGELPSVRHASWNTLDIKQLYVESAVRIIMFILMIGGLYAYFIWKDVLMLSWQVELMTLVVILILLVLQIGYLVFTFRFRAYALRQHDILYRHGWLWRSEMIVPYKRIQHAEISQGIWQRYFGLSSLLLYTAGGDSSDLSIRGLQLEVAQQIKDFIVKEIEYLDEEE